MITILGSSGFIGSNLVKRLNSDNLEVYAPGKGCDLRNRDLGHVIYCIGLTADFRQKPFETVEAHVTLLNQVLRDCKFESLLYLSSTRVYINSAEAIATEEDSITINPADADELYTLTKLTGERLCLSSGRNTKIVRLSNIIGDDSFSDNFFTDIIRNIKNTGQLSLKLSLNSSKDYLFINDAITIIIDIVLKGKEQIYNVASGVNINNEQIICELRKHLKFVFNVHDAAKDLTFPIISIEKIKKEFNFQPQNILELIPTLLK